MRLLCVFGQHAYGNPLRDEGYEYANFLPALKRLGHDVSFFESFSRQPYQNFTELNRALLKRVEETSPDVVLCVLMLYEVWIETMRLIRKSGPMVVNWSTDDSWKYPMFSRFLGPESDLSVTTFPDALGWYQENGIFNVCLSQWAANQEMLMPPIPAAGCRYAVSFIGAAYGNRPKMVEALRREGIEVSCFGHGWPNGPIETKRIAEIIQSSQLSLNFSSGSQQGAGGINNRQIKARVFEVPGYGGCLLTERAPFLEQYFRVGEEILTFEGCEELVATIKSLLAAPARRDAIARRGFDRVRRDHTYDRRFYDLLEDLNARTKERPRYPVDWKDFETVAKRHTLGWGLRLFRGILVACASVFWGRHRGSRAARRFVFEVYWRLYGARTYTAAGWPGRMFYRES